jgi:hypothetical protein
MVDKSRPKPELETIRLAFSETPEELARLLKQARARLSFLEERPELVDAGEFGLTPDVPRQLRDQIAVCEKAIELKKEWARQEPITTVGAHTSAHPLGRGFRGQSSYAVRGDSIQEVPPEATTDANAKCAPMSPGAKQQDVENTKSSQAEPASTEAGPPMAEAARDPAERRQAVDAYIEEVFAKTEKRITRKDIWTAMRYKSRTEFERWERNDVKHPNKTANQRFNRFLREKPHLK